MKIISLDSNPANTINQIFTKPSFNTLNAAHSKVDALKNGIWIYFFLLIFEGGLRKWLLPGLATPLLIVRDPLAIWLIFKSWQQGLLPRNFYLTTMALVGFVGIFTALFAGHGNVIIAVYGARPFLIHFPLIFVIGKVFNREDVVKMGNAILWLSIPMAILIALQFYSPQSSWVNRGIGGDMKGAGFNGGALGFFRPSGTFSFTTGNSQFYSMVAPFVIFSWLSSKNINKFILMLATLSLIVAIPFSISRSLLFQVSLSFFFAVIAISRKPKYLFRMLLIVGGVVLVLMAFSDIPIIQTPIKVFTTRFTNANNVEGGLQGTFGGRFPEYMIEAVNPSSNIPFWGYGMGLGSNVASSLLTGGRTFLLAEDEWLRTVGELGLLLGLGVILTRMGLTFKIAFASFKSIGRGNILPWILLSDSCLLIIQGQWTQPTTLGFTTLLAGLTIAAIRD